METKLPVTLVLADTLAEARTIMLNEKLKFTDTAFITEPHYLDVVKLHPNERVYISAKASTELNEALQTALYRDIGPGQKLQVSYVVTEPK